MGFFTKLFGKKNEPAHEDVPFMEHPTGEFDTAYQAICSAMQRLDQMAMEGRWITFCGQGQGQHPDSYHIEDVRFSGRTFDLIGETVDLESILNSADLSGAGINVEISADGKVTLGNATSEQLASFLDALFRKHYGIKPFDDEGDDYAVGAEW